MNYTKISCYGLINIVLHLDGSNRHTGKELTNFTLFSDVAGHHSAKNLCVLIGHSRMLSAIIVHHDVTPQNSAQLGLCGTCRSKTRQGRGTSPFPNQLLATCLRCNINNPGWWTSATNEQTAHLQCENKEVQRGHTSLLSLTSLPQPPHPQNDLKQNKGS